jgi:hypothetical protein
MGIPRPGLFTSRVAQGAGWAPGPVWTGRKNLSPTGDSIPRPPGPKRVATPTTLSRPTLYRSTLYRPRSPGPHYTDHAIPTHAIPAHAIPAHAIPTHAIPTTLSRSTRDEAKPLFFEFHHALVVFLKKSA